MNTILFDLDGTLLDTLDDLTNAVNYALTTLGEPLRAREEVRSFVGDGYALLMERAVTDKSKKESALVLFNAYYAKHCEDCTKPYEGVVQSLKTLYGKGRKMAIVSNKGNEAVQVLCKKFFAPYVTTYFGVTPTMPKKPAPDMLFSAMRALSVDKSDCIMVGDGEPDLAMARSAGIDCVSVLWGFRSRKQLTASGATRFLSNPEELADL